MPFFSHSRTGLLLLAFAIAAVAANAQGPSFNFHHLGTASGLSDPAVRNITQDKYGYIWMGTVNGLSRFDGYEVKVFQHQSGDSVSLAENLVLSLVTDSAGTLWLGQSGGLYRYDYSSSRFIRQPGSEGIAAYKMLVTPKGMLCMATNKGLFLFDTGTGIFSHLGLGPDSTAQRLLMTRVNDICLGKENSLYIASANGLIRYNFLQQRAEKINVPGLAAMDLQGVAVDSAGNIWISYGDNGLRLMKISKDLTSALSIDQFLQAGADFTDNRITSLFIDLKQRVWLSSARMGICLYHPLTHTFIAYKHDPLQVTSISDNLTNCLFQDRQGYIWVGTEVSGVNYFHPDKTFFRSIQPSFNQTPSLPDFWCRAAAEDNHGNLWLGTGKGVARFDPAKNTYQLFQHTNDKTNALPYNSVRSLLCDGDLVWMGTGNGLNRYNRKTGEMKFLDEKDGVPRSFYWTMLRDSEGNIWIGCRDGIYRYNSKTKAIENFAHDAVLAPYARTNTISLFEDSRHRIWFGFYSRGALMYDPSEKKIRQWSKDRLETSLSDNHVTSIAEDKRGVLWMATLEGLNALDEETGRFTHYLCDRGVAAEKTSGLLVDQQNRLWLAGSRRLYMLDAARKFFTPFDMSDGLPSVDFNGQAACKLRNGEFVYPTLRGFVQFNPGKYMDKNHISGFFINAFTINGKKQTRLSNFEDHTAISLDPSDNFFSLDLIALNYGNPRETWYAHQLEPFDKEWIYSKGRTVNYTNVPGGDYVFRYKTSTDMNNWAVPEKFIRVHIATVFYKAWWFRLLLAGLIAMIVIAFYKFRIIQKEKFFSLQAKANALEKEKAMVMYESLKQQLNPHFLFNSLTSLSGLIASNPDNARQFLDRMSKIYRYILKSRDNETVSLAEEIKLADTYTRLQQTRFRDGLLVDIKVADECLHRKIAPVTIQNLIENAIKHNIIDDMKPLMIRIYTEEDQLIVKNNLQKKKFVETSNRQGLANLQSLYYYLSGKPVVIAEDDHSFTVKIPLI